MDVQVAINAGVAAGVIYSSNASYVNQSVSEIKIAFDSDAVIFSDESEKIYQSGQIAL